MCNQASSARAWTRHLLISFRYLREHHGTYWTGDEDGNLDRNGEPGRMDREEVIRIGHAKIARDATRDSEDCG